MPVRREMIPCTEHVLPACFASGAKRRCSRTNLGGGQTLLGGLDDELNDLLGAEVVLQPLRVLAQVAPRNGTYARSRANRGQGGARDTLSGSVHATHGWFLKSGEHVFSNQGKTDGGSERREDNAPTLTMTFQSSTASTTGTLSARTATYSAEKTMQHMFLACRQYFPFTFG